MKFQDLDPSIKVSVASIIFFKLFNIMKKKFNYETIIGIDISKKTAGKHMMSILNALRNKLLHTICACVRKNEKYEKIYAKSLV